MPGSRETGGSLALRALGRGSLYAFGGFSFFCFALWKLSGANTVSDHSPSVTALSFLLCANKYLGMVTPDVDDLMLCSTIRHIHHTVAWAMSCRSKADILVSFFQHFTHKFNLWWHTHTHNRFTALLEFVRDHPGEQVPER